MYVEKAKSYDTFNPNDYMYRFDITKRGTQFKDIHEVEMCFACHGSGIIKSKGTSSQCSSCWGLGYTDVLSDY